MVAEQMVYGVPMISFAGDGFCVPDPVELTVKKRLHRLSNINYEVSDIKGNLFLQVDGSYMTLYRQRVMRNSAGFPILTIREKAITGEKWIVHKGESSETSKLLSTVHRSHFLLKKTRFDVFLGGNINEDISNFQVVGSSYSSLSYRVYKGDTIIAEVNYNMSKGIFWQSKKENFRVKVQSGVDYAFILALIIILVECE
ncbi:hypothetical protein REPUB_Repub13aG0107900 [Reevesia pubescens]